MDGFADPGDGGLASAADSLGKLLQLLKGNCDGEALCSALLDSFGDGCATAISSPKGNGFASARSFRFGSMASEMTRDSDSGGTTPTYGRNRTGSWVMKAQETMGTRQSELSTTTPRPVVVAAGAVAGLELLKQMDARDKELASLREAHEKEIDRLVAVHEMKVMDLRKMHEEDLGRAWAAVRERDDELARTKSQHAADIFNAVEASRARLKTAHDVELKRLRAAHEEELCQSQASVLEREEELVRVKARHAADAREANEALQASQAEVALLRFDSSGDGPKRCDVVEAENDVAGANKAMEELRAALCEREEENLGLRSELRNKAYTLSQLEASQERAHDDCTQFLCRLATTSSHSALGSVVDLRSADVLGMGNWGYVISCISSSSGSRVVVKLMSERASGMAVREWAHGSGLVHAHIVKHTDAVMHRDTIGEVSKLLKAGFESGRLAGKRPMFFPSCYFCLALEYMDRGTVQHLMDRRLLSAGGIGAITYEIASALSYMHRKKRTHNDIKPENILLTSVSGSDRLVAKLADLGLADHSIERHRDHSLFAYTVWCMCVNQKFSRCPRSAEDLEDAVVRIRDAEPRPFPGTPSASKTELRNVWVALVKTVGGLWRQGWDMDEVLELEPLQNLEMSLPAGNAHHARELEAEAAHDVKRRIVVATHRWELKRAKARKVGRSLSTALGLGEDMGDSDDEPPTDDELVRPKQSKR
eukprot:TRINITY_DN4221_c1_g1_i1.p1 TRINITY_DN4221_c1_g1~~TRINITY_DN4221_c1_g1_i1.p1  ORF type:complete len:710 (+),score=120.60 TRINITY_DN4221_c1_g1_i1:106-2235(+)